MTPSLELALEAILFWKGEPLEFKTLAKMLDCPVEQVITGLADLDKSLATRGLRLILTETEATLGTAPELASLIQNLHQAELSQELSRAALETLTIVIYEGPVTKAKIDYIRGVNSQFIIRHLLLKGLVERVVNQNDTRSFLYQTTTELLGHLGLTRREDLPDYQLAHERLRNLAVEAEAVES